MYEANYPEVGLDVCPTTSPTIAPRIAYRLYLGHCDVLLREGSHGNSIQGHSSGAMYVFGC